VAFVAGLLFAVGLCLSGMTDPARVQGFLDVFGRWDPSLAFVMVGAIGVHASLFQLISRRRAPILAAVFSLPGRGDVDARLVAGAIIFGVGWGLSGYCPGPAVTSLASGARPAIIFTAAMILGFLLHGVLDREEGGKVWPGSDPQQASPAGNDAESRGESSPAARVSPVGDRTGAGAGGGVLDRGLPR
jgi:hypothetical protein